MSEELEALENIGNIDLGDNPYKTFEHNKLKNVYSADFNAIKQALLKAQEDETKIEILKEKNKEYLSRLENLEKYSLEQEKENAELKTQEPKQYLKWEDLEFKDYEQEISVLLNDNKYSLKYILLPDDDYYMVWIYKENKCIFSLDGKYLENKQFFNDLRLERVEE